MSEFEELEITEVIECDPPDERPPVWRRDWLAGWRWAQARGRALREGLLWLAAWPNRFFIWITGIPRRIGRGIIQLPWGSMMTVRRGFVFGAMSGFSVMSSALWAISTLPYFPGHPPTPAVVIPHRLPIARASVPAELAWFFIQYPYLSENVTFRAKNHHTYIVSDPSRRREYVVAFGQRYRRVEIYGIDEKGSQQVQLYTPGARKTVLFQGNKIASQSTASDGNLWMWNNPLWNDVNLKIYSMADLWLDSPFKRYSCAGFVHKFLHDAGVNVPILDAWDIAKQPWVRIPVEEMEPGDIVTIRAASARHRHFWHHAVTHVGVYVGHGKLIHAATSSRSLRAWIRLADLNDFRGRIDKVLRPPELL